MKNQNIGKSLPSDYKFSNGHRRAKMKIHYNGAVMGVQKDAALKLQDAGWTIVIEEDALLSTFKYASDAWKEFEKPGDAMHEVERLLNIRVDVEPGDHDGCHLHSFIWEASPEQIELQKKEHEERVAEVKRENPAFEPYDFSPFNNHASGWQCMHYMYGVPLDPHACAKQFKHLMELASALWGNCKVVYWPKDGSYPLEHTMGANKNMRREIEAELLSLMPTK